MEQMNGNELRSVLIEKNLIDEAGTINAFKANLISGAHTWPLLSEVWNLYQEDLALIEELQTFLNAVYEQGQYDILIGILKILYNCCALLIPDDMRVRFLCGEFDYIEHFKAELIEYLDYYNNRRVKAKLKGLPPAVHRRQTLCTVQ